MTAVIVTGLVIGGRRERITTAQTRLQLHSVYQTVIFLLESVVFSLIGLQLPTLIRDLSHGEAWPAEALAVAGTLIVTRASCGCSRCPPSSSGAAASGVRRGRFPPWCPGPGTRGVVPLAAALSIPLTMTDGTPLPQRDLILVLATAVIVISLVVQGLTLEPLVRVAGIARAERVRQRRQSPGSAWPRRRWPGWTNSPTMTAPLMTLSTGPGPAWRPGSGAPVPGSTATSRRSRAA